MNTTITLIATLPFFLLLLGIAFLPLINEHWWENNWNKAIVSAICAFISVIAFYWGSSEQAPAAISHSIEEFISFFILIFSLFVVSGGITLQGIMKPSPKINCLILGLGAILSSLIGTTGASMLLIRPLLKANINRKHNAHTVIFFILIVSNTGGCLTPLGDPPLFIGYLKGIPFFWFLNLLGPWLIINCTLLATYYVWDTYFYLHRDFVRGHLILENRNLSLRGKLNFVWLFLIICCIILITPANIDKMNLPHFTREAIILLIAIISYFTTDKELHEENQFCFSPIIEVGVIFSGIFLCMPPVLFALQQNTASLPLSRAWHYFWATGALSSFLDNTPTFAVFFELAANKTFTSDYGQIVANSNVPFAILKAISTGAVFMGAITYIGNGPNLMVKAIAEKDGVKMPSFFAYMAYSIPLLMPAFIAITLIWFR